MNVTFNTTSLIAFHFDAFSIHFGVYRKQDSLKSYNNPSEYVEIKNWLWGRAYEPYDLCLLYYGFGPFCYVAKPTF